MPPGAGPHKADSNCSAVTVLVPLSAVKLNVKGLKFPPLPIGKLWEPGVEKTRASAPFTYEVEDPPLIEPDDATVSVFAPPVTTPLVRVSVPFTVVAALSVTPEELLMVRLPKEDREVC